MSNDVADHDGAYRRIFSNPVMVRDLVRGYVSDTFVNELDFDAMERVDTSFRTAGLQRRESDMIWKIPTVEGDPLYVMLMLEFQSSVDRNMASRVLTYVALLYDQLTTSRKLLPGGKLPPVLPIVLDNGEATWSAPVELAEMIDLEAGHMLWKYQPHLRYYLLDEGRVSLDELKEIGGPVSVLIELEQVTDVTSLTPAMRRLGPQVRLHPDLDELFAIWFAHVFEPTTGLKLTHDEIRQLHMEEGMSMIQQTVAKWKREAIEQGLEQGLEQGRAEGRRQVLAHMLELKFGASVMRSARLQSLDDARLDRLTELLVTSPERSEDDLFDALPPKDT